MSRKPLLAWMVLAQLSFAGWQVIPSGTEETLNGGAFMDADKGFLVGSRGAFLRTDDAGLTWSKVDLGVGNELTGIHFTDARRGFVCGSGGLILRTVDSGRTWEKAVTPDTGHITDISFASPAVGFAMGKYDSVLATSDSGKTWSARRIFDGPKPAVNSVRACFPTEKIGYLVSSVQLFRTEDGGLTWNPVTGVQWGASYLSDCWFAHPDTGFVSAVTFGSLVRTLDGGQSTRLVHGYSTTRVRFLNRTVGYAISGSHIQRSANGGEDWIPDGKFSDFVESGAAPLALVMNGVSVAFVTGEKGLILRKAEAPTALHASAPDLSAPHPSAKSPSAAGQKTKNVRLDGRAISPPTGRRAAPSFKRP